MKTSIAYRLFRLYFNDHADNHELFGNRVHNPLNQANKTEFLNNYGEVLLRGAAIVGLGIALIYSVMIG